jgi:hypothetical protein
MSIYYSTLKGRAWADAIQIAEDVFEPYLEREAIADCLRISDPDLSISVFDGGEVIGAYFLSRNDFFQMQFSSYPGGGMPDLTAICGEGLVLKPMYRGMGIGSYLRGWPAQQGVDYVWGRHLKTLNNLDVG